MPWLVRARLRGPLAATWRGLTHPRTIRDQWDVRRDYRAFRRQHRALLASGAPSVGRAKRLLVVSLSDWVLQVKTESILTKALQARGYEPLMVTHSEATWARRYYRLFGLNRWVLFDQKIEEIPITLVTQDLEHFLNQASSIQAIKKFQYRGVNIGRQVLATMTRSLYASCDVTSADFRRRLRTALRQSLRSVLAAERLIDEYRPDAALFLEKDYLGIGSLYDVSLNRGVDTVQWCLAHRDDSFMLKRFSSETRNLHPKSLSATTWEALSQMPWTAEHEAALEREFTLRYREGKWVSYYNRPAGSVKPPQEIRRQLGLDPSKKTAVVFSHVLWDSTFFWGEDLFDDYAEWLVETVKVACRNPAVNWVIKLHPANAWKLIREGVRGELYDRRLLQERVGALPAHVQILDPDADLNTYALFGLTDYCVTVRGTIGTEMACHGIPVLTAGTGRYSGFGFTIDSSSRDAYVQRLARIQDIPPLSAAQVILAKKYAYGIFVLRPWKVSSFENTYLPLRVGGHPLDHNLDMVLRSPEEFATAPDLRAFAQWVCDAHDLDFLSAQPRAGAPTPAALPLSEAPVVARAA